jgi:hypothetical protein
MPQDMRRALVLTVAPALSVAAVVVLAPRSSPAPAQVPLPAPPGPGVTVPRPRPLAARRDVTRVAPVARPVVARVAPAPHAAPVARASARTPEGTTNLLEVLGRARRGRGGPWLRVRLAVLPNGKTGWVPRRTLGGWVFLDTRLVVDRARFRATLYRDGRPVLSAPVGVGRPNWPTPAGAFYVRDRLTRFASRAYGPVAFGTSARSVVLTDWPAGGYVGIHGTDRPGLIPGAISHGCIRMRNPDIVRLARLMPVGTPVIVR